MSDMISRAQALALMENQLIVHDIEDDDNELTKAYEAGFRNAVNQMILELSKMGKRGGRR